MISGVLAERSSLWRVAATGAVAGVTWLSAKISTRRRGGEPWFQAGVPMPVMTMRALLRRLSGHGCHIGDEEACCAAPSFPGLWHRPGRPGMPERCLLRALLMLTSTAGEPVCCLAGAVIGGGAQVRGALVQLAVVRGCNGVYGRPDPARTDLSGVAC